MSQCDIVTDPSTAANSQIRNLEPFAIAYGISSRDEENKTRKQSQNNKALRKVDNWIFFFENKHILPETRS